MADTSNPKRTEVRKLSAILAADVAGYSRLMGIDEVRTVRDLAERREIMDRRAAKLGARIEAPQEVRPVPTDKLE